VRDLSGLYDVLHATWPAAETRRAGPWTLRRGDGGGSRVSAATLDGGIGEFEAAEAGMRAWGQRPIFMVRSGEAALDAALEERGGVRFDPTVLMVAETDRLAGEVDAATMVCDAPLARLAEIWAGGGVGPARLAVMARACAPKTWLLGRTGDHAVAAAFVAIHGRTAMLHALEVAPEARRAGLGAAMTRAAARWAGVNGADRLALAVTEANAPARALYAGLGFRKAGEYHYRRSPEPI
jgi:ribosomal protein S18 acetylase RimI-like enzyme